MPIIENIKPSYQKTINSSIDKLDDSQQLLQYFIDDISTKYVQVKKGLVTIPLSELINIPGCTTLLYHLIKDYKFTTSQVLSILKAINHTGARFSTSSHQAIIDRTNLLIQESKPELTHEYNLDLLSTVIINGLGTIQCSKYDDSKLHKNIAILDHSKLEFPLRIRKWMPGDKFQPSGMGGKYKKVKKYLTDIKLSRFEKDNIYVLANKNEICWVIGHRVDERYKGNDTMVSITT